MWGSSPSVRLKLSQIQPEGAHERPQPVAPAVFDPGSGQQRPGGGDHRPEGRLHPGPVPGDLTPPVIGGTIDQLKADIEGYRAIGLDELIIPDGLLGDGAARLRAMDTVLSLVRD